MNILVVGVSGFIGRHIYTALAQQGYNLKGCSRRYQADINWHVCDFANSNQDWDALLDDIDVVINAVGIFKQTASQSFSNIHDLGPRKLFVACSRHNVKVIQISAIGAEKNSPPTAFLRTKRIADQHLLSGKTPAVILYPGIVLGEQGRTTQQLSMVSRLFCIPLVFVEKQLPLISIYQLTEKILDIVRCWPEKHHAEVVIARSESMKLLLNQLRHWMGLQEGRFLPIPDSVIRLVFLWFPGISIGVFNKQSVDLMAAHSITQYPSSFAETATDSLSRHPASFGFIQQLHLSILLYANIFSISLIWIVSGLSSIINFEQSRELISLVGIVGNNGDAIIILAAIGDVLLGLLILFPKIRTLIVYTQLTLMIIYTLIITIAAPILLLHPFAPIIKNLAMLIMSLYIIVQERR